MPDCAACSLFQLESENEGCLHVNRPGGLELTKSALASCQLLTGSSILDSACGAGTTCQFLREQGFQVTGMDLSLDMLKKNTNNPSAVSLIQANCAHIPLSTASQDAVLMECALSLSNASHHALTEFYRLLKPGGWLVVTDIYIRELKDPHALACLSGTSCLSGVKTEEQIRKMVEPAGFSIHCWQDQTQAFKQWLARMVFKLGSLNTFYRQLASCEENSLSLANTLGSNIKLGYYWMTAQKAA